MRNITFDECNDAAEVCGLFNKVFANQEQLEAKIVQNAQKIEALKPKKGSKMKSKGSASMRVIAILMLIVALAGLSFGIYVPTDINSEICANHDTLSIFLRDVLGNMASDAYLFNPRSDPPQAVEGRVYYDSDDFALLLYNGTSWQTIDRAGGLGLNAAYDFGGAGSGRQIDTTDGPVVMAATEAGNNISLLITQGDTNGSYSALRITSAGAVADDITIDIDSQGTGRDIEGTAASWYITGAGVIVGASADFTGAAGITLSNDETITNATDHQIKFADNGGGYEDISIVFGSNDGIIGLATSTAADTFEFGVIDDLTGVGGIAFDAAASVVTLAASGDAQDLTISVTNAHDSSLVLVSAGTAANAIDIDTTAGGITINVGGTASAGEDFAVTTTTSIHLIGGENVTDAVNIDATGTNGGIDLDTTNGPITLTTAGADNGDMTLTVADKFTLISTDTAAAGIDIEANGGGNETIHIHSNQGTSQASIEFLSDVGGITSTASAVPDGQYGHILSGSISTATRSEGLGLYVAGNTSGNADGKVYAAGIWLNITNGTPTDVPDSLMAALDIGIYAAAAPTLAATQLRVLNIEYQVHASAAPVQTTSMMHFNCDDTQDVPDYWFTTGNIASVNYEVNTNTSTCSVTTKAGAIKVYIGAQGVRYIWLYTDAGT